MNPRFCLLLLFALVARAEDPALRLTLSGHTNAVTSLAFSPDGRSLVSASRDGTIKLWDLASDKTLCSHTAEVHCVVFSPDGRTIAATIAKTVLLWDAVSGKEIAKFEGHTNSVRSVAFSLDSKTLASAEYANVFLWDVEKRAKIESFKSKNGATAVAFSPDGKTLASEQASRIVLYDLNAGTNRELTEKEPGPRQCKFLTFTADGKTLIESVRCIPEKIRFWNLAGDARTVTLKPEKFDPAEWFYAIHVDAERKTLTSARSSGKITFWNTETQTPIATFEDPQHFTAAIFTPDGKTLAAATADFKIKIFSMEAYKASKPSAKEIDVQF